MDGRASSWQTSDMQGTPIGITPSLAPIAGSLSGIHLGSIVSWFFFGLVFLIWALSTLAAIYHWLRYSYRSFMTLPMLILHAFVSYSLLMYTWSSMAG